LGSRQGLQLKKGGTQQPPGAAGQREKGSRRPLARGIKVGGASAGVKPADFFCSQRPTFLKEVEDNENVFC
jgi:hypothetical protein